MSFLAAAAKAPDAPIELKLILGVAFGIMLAVVFDKIQRAQVEAFEAVVAGDADVCARVLAKRRSGGRMAELDPMGTLALEIRLGHAEGARRTLAQPAVKIGPAAHVRSCVQAHADLTSPGPPRTEVLANLLATPAPRFPPAERYRAFLIASAALEPVEPSIVASAINALARSRSKGARPFAAWVRAAHDVPLDPREGLDETREAADLARKHSLPALAARIDARAAAIERALLGLGPYR